MSLTRDDAFRVVCNLRTPASAVNEIKVGTGVFMSTDGADAYLITASHVAEGTNNRTVIAIQWEDGRCATVPLVDLSNNLGWKHHEVADISVLKLDETEFSKMIAANRCLPLSCFNLERKPASRDDELTSIGFPNGLGIDGMFCPLSFRSFASSGYLTLNRADTGTPSVFFCLENPSVGGYSGCPVIDLGYMVSGLLTQRKGNPVVHGIMHGTMSDVTGGKIALVTPAFYLRDLL